MRTDDKLKEICDSLRTSYGDIHTSARRCGVSVDFLMRWIKDDKEAAAAIQEAQHVGYMGLESVAIDRATIGVEKGIYFKGAKIGSEFTPSDTLLAKVMEARIPAYKKGEGSTATFNGPTQINIMPRAENFDQWLEMKKSTLDARAAQKALAAPATKIPEILQGDFVEVHPNKCLEGLL